MRLPARGRPRSQPLCVASLRAADTVAEQMSGRRRVELTIVRPADKDLCEVAREEGVDEWTQWEKAVVGCANGEDRELDGLCAARGSDVVATRRLSPLEAIAFNSAHNLRLASGQRLADVASQYGHLELAAKVFQLTQPVPQQIFLTDADGALHAVDEEGDAEADKLLAALTANMIADEESEDDEEDELLDLTDQQVITLLQDPRHET